MRRETSGNPSPETTSNPKLANASRTWGSPMTASELLILVICHGAPNQVHETSFLQADMERCPDAVRADDGRNYGDHTLGSILAPAHIRPVGRRRARPPRTHDDPRRHRPPLPRMDPPHA